MKVSINVHSIKFRLIFFSLLFIIVPVLASTFVLQYGSISILKRLFIQSSMNDLKQVRINIDNVIENAESNLNPFILNDDLKYFLLENSSLDSPDNYVKMVNISNIINAMVDSTNWIDSIYVYDMNDITLYTSAMSILQGTNYMDSVVFTEAVSKQRILEWIPNVRCEPPFTVVKDRLVTLAMPIKIYSTDTCVGYVFINVNEAMLYDSIQRMDPFFPEEIMITNKDGEILSYHDKKWFGKSFAEYAGENKFLEIDAPELFNRKENVLMLTHVSERTSLVYHSFVPISVFRSQITALRNTIIGISFFIMAVTVILTLRFMRQIYIPIRKLSGALKNLTIGKGSHIEKMENRKDEFGLLYESYNKTVDRLKMLFANLLSEKLASKNMKIKLLQAQINPHLIYNTLNSIYCISRLYNIKEITELSFALSSFFRLSLMEGSEHVRVREMIEHIRFFIKIQNIRMNGRIKFDVDIDESLMDYRILKLLHQPIVENAIVHGLNESDKDIRITISGHITQNKLTFIIKDDGKGLPAEKIAELNLNLNSLGGAEDTQEFFALRNIQERIKFYYGAEYGIALEPAETTGLTVTMVLPFDEKLWEKNV